jgi:protein ImuB
LAEPVRVVGVGAVRAELAGLPIEAVEPEARVLEVLRLWRVRTLGDLVDLPRAEIGRRLGEAGLEAWDRAAGGRERPLRPAALPEVFEEEAEPGFAVESLDPLVFLLRRQLGQLVLRLGAAGRAAGKLRLELVLEDGSVHGRDFALAEASLDADRLLRVMLTHIEGVRAPAPVRAVRLRAQPASRDLRQTELFEASLRDPGRFAETVSSLAALYGPARVGMPSREASWRPDACGTEPPLESVPAAEGGRAPGLALRRWRPPLQARVEVGGGGRPLRVVSREAEGVVRSARGPWHNTGGWWEAGGWCREEWDVELEGGGLYRLVRCPEAGWSLEGMYD